MDKKVLGIFAHPDDAEIICAGTLALLHKAGWEVHIATMTMGDKGSAVHTSDEISRMRTAEAKNSAQVINATYHCLEFDDVYILYDRETLNRTTALVRKVAPSLVLTHSPSDYMVDHEMTSRIVQTACFAAGVKLMEVGEEHFEPVPYLIYSDPLEGKDILGNLVQPTFYVDITQEIGIKEKMLACHASQRNWLMAHHKVDEYILAMKRFGEQRGQEINVAYAEGFRQHLGHSFPQDNILKEILGDKVILH